MILSTQRIPGGDLVENHCFIEVKLANVCRFLDFDRGAMREKMAIFKVRNSVCKGYTFFQEQFGRFNAPANFCRSFLGLPRTLERMLLIGVSA